MIVSKMRPVVFSKKSEILSRGDICDAVYFIEQGITRMYYFNEEAKEFTCQIAYNKASNFIDHFATDYTSLVTQSPSHYTIEALEDTTLLKISLLDLQILQSALPSFNDFITKITNQIHQTLQSCIIDLNTVSNDDRYRQFVADYPDIHDKIPQYIVASYLGITPVALSRLKKR